MQAQLEYGGRSRIRSAVSVQASLGTLSKIKSLIANSGATINLA